jgi:hypothetical protein
VKGRKEEGSPGVEKKRRKQSSREKVRVKKGKYCKMTKRCRGIGTYGVVEGDKGVEWKGG